MVGSGVSVAIRIKEVNVERESETNLVPSIYKEFSIWTSKVLDKISLKDILDTRGFSTAGDGIKSLICRGYRLLEICLISQTAHQIVRQGADKIRLNRLHSTVTSPCKQICATNRLPSLTDDLICTLLDILIEVWPG
jgi:hypothetical protein